MKLAAALKCLLVLSIFMICSGQSGCVTTERIIERPVVVEKEVLVERGSDQWLRDKGKERTVPSYEATGEEWGKRMAAWVTKHGDKRCDSFIHYLLLGPRWNNQPYDSEDTEFLEETTKESYYFRVHTNLKRAFQRGFQTGYVHRNADLILGPHITEAASILGRANAMRFRLNIETYQERSQILLDALRASVADEDKNTVSTSTAALIETTIEDSIELFKELIAEGSPADRDRFKNEFIAMFKADVETYMQDNKAFVPQEDQKFKLQYGLPSEKEKRDKLLKQELPEQDDPARSIYLVDHGLTFNTTLSVATASEVWAFIYEASLEGVGIEMGQKYGHNLISRDEVLDWLRRAMVALNPKNLKVEQGLILKGFAQAYNADDPAIGKKVFANLIGDTGLEN